MIPILAVLEIILIFIALLAICILFWAFVFSDVFAFVRRKRQHKEEQENEKKGDNET